MNIDTHISDLRGIGLKFLPKLKKLGTETVRDLLWHFPYRYEDWSQIVDIAELKAGQGEQAKTIQGIVKSIETRNAWRRRMVITEAVIKDETGEVKAIWFNQPYIGKILRVGARANFAGKLTEKNSELTLSNPTHELIGKNETKHTARLVPIYPETKGLTSKGIRFLIKSILDNITPIDEFIPQEILDELELPEINEALKWIHFPADATQSERARNRFAFEEIFLLQLRNLRQKIARAKDKAQKVEFGIEEVQKILESLPFELTKGQKESLWEILKDISGTHPSNTPFRDTGQLAEDQGARTKAYPKRYAEDAATQDLSQSTVSRRVAADLSSRFVAPRQSSTSTTDSSSRLAEIDKSPSNANGGIAGMGSTRPMNRLLQGDVGSGKTIVVGIAAIIAAGQYQVAIMAPTEILARQHYKTFLKFFGNFSGGIGLLAGKEAKIFYGKDLETPSKKESVAKDVAKGNIKILIGTHSLIQKSVKFHNLGLVIVDEQHRFGVEQRDTMLKNKTLVPHFLSMSATPIPRTLMFTLFGDLDLSLISELPKGRREIITKIVAPENRMKAYAFIRGQVRKGDQVFIICPRIEAVEVKDNEVRELDFTERLQIDTKNVKEEHEKLSKKIFPDLKVAMLHGKMKGPEKEKIMKDFAEKKYDILVSTSVIEVGVDIPNATIIVIEGADKFGLAQLYQFKGRVGRGEKQSFCFLFTDSSTEKTKNRLESLVNAKNGFELAEYDLKMRGPGEFLGDSQTGLPDIAMQALQNPTLLKETRDSAEKILASDPELKNHPNLKGKLAEFQETVHLE